MYGDVVESCCAQARSLWSIHHYRVLFVPPYQQTLADHTIARVTESRHGMAWHGMAWHGMAWHRLNKDYGRRYKDVPRAVDAPPDVRLYCERWGHDVRLL